MSHPRPNILYIHSHDTGRYVQPYGHAVTTPHIQRLAEDGILFRQAFSAAPTCSPSRASLLTGQAAHTSGMLGLAHRGFALTDYQQHLQHTLRAQAGYRTVLCGMQHIAADPARIGYDAMISPADGHDPDAVAAATVDFLHNAPQEPFFLSTGFWNTHREFPAPGPEDDPRYTLPPAPLPDTPEVRADMAAFKTSARRMDRAIGRVLEALEATGLADNTLVICTTDHGIAFPAMKCNLTDHGIGVMLIMRGPGGFSGGRVIDGLVSHVDLYPTLMELLGLDAPDWLHGHSLLPLIREEAAEVNDAIFAEVTYHAAYEPQRAVRTARWKYIRRFDDRPTRVMPNVDDSPSKTVWLRAGWIEHALPAEALYDLTFDPQEVHNLADDPDYAGVLASLRERLHQWMVRTHDPLLKGSVPLPSGAEVNPVDGLSPNEPTIRAD